MIVRTEKDGETVVAVGDNCHDLARILGITPQAVSHGIHRGSRLYHLVNDDEDQEGEMLNDRGKKRADARTYSERRLEQIRTD